MSLVAVIAHRFPGVDPWGLTREQALALVARVPDAVGYAEPQERQAEELRRSKAGRYV